jgi:hypothetical protein
MIRKARPAISSARKILGGAMVDHQLAPIGIGRRIEDLQVFAGHGVVVGLGVEQQQPADSVEKGGVVSTH